MIVRQRAPPVSEFIAREPAAQRACRPGGIQCYANWRVCRNPAIAAIECAIAAEFSGACGVQLATTAARASTIYGEASGWADPPTGCLATSRMRPGVVGSARG